VAREAPDADVVVVSHGAVMHALWRHVDGAWSTRRVARNAGVFVAEHRGGAWDRIVAMDEISGG
jgi:broad specificity phosphatase PhoE